MSERNNSEKSLQEILGEALERDAADVTPSPMSYEQFQSMLSERKQVKRKKRTLRIAGVAALFMIVLVSAALVFRAFTTDVGANKNAPEEIITEDGVVIEDKGWGNSGEDCWTITNWDEIETVKATFPDLMIPRYIPEGYEFEELTVERVVTGDTAYMYLFLNGRNEQMEIEIVSTGKNEIAINIDHVSRILTCNKGKVYIQEDNKMATVQIDDGQIIHILNNLSDEEIVKIIESLEI